MWAKTWRQYRSEPAKPVGIGGKSVPSKVGVNAWCPRSLLGPEQTEQHQHSLPWLVSQTVYELNHNNWVPLSGGSRVQYKVKIVPTVNSKCMSYLLYTCRLSAHQLSRKGNQVCVVVPPGCRYCNQNPHLMEQVPHGVIMHGAALWTDGLPDQPPWGSHLAKRIGESGCLWKTAVYHYMSWVYTCYQ